MRNSYSKLGLMGKSGIQGISNSKVDADLEQVVLQNNESSEMSIDMRKTGLEIHDIPSVKEGGIAQDRLEGVERIGSVDETTSNPPI